MFDALCTKTSPSAVPRALGRQELTHLAEAACRHTAVDRLVLTGSDLIGLMPYPDISATFRHSFVERHPRRPMLPVTAARVGLQGIERSPVLNQGETSGLDAEEPTRSAT